MPDPWSYDGGKRREPVLDTDYHPPRVVRQVGWRHCMKCTRPFFSEDAVRLRMCYDCRHDEDRFVWANAIARRFHFACRAEG